MKITSVRSFLLSYPFAEPIRLPFHGGERTILKRDAMFIRVEADNGLVGYAPGPGSERAHLAIQQTIAPYLQDRTLADPDALRVLFLQGAGVDSFRAPDWPPSLQRCAARSRMPPRPPRPRPPACPFRK